MWGWSSARHQTSTKHVEAFAVAGILLMLSASISKGSASYRFVQGNSMRRPVRIQDVVPAVCRLASAKISQTSSSDKDPHGFIRKGGKIEVQAPSKTWREAEVKKVSSDGVTVHYVGYDSQFDEKIPFKSARLRAAGELRRAKLKDLKISFEFQSKPGQCPACGVQMQCTNPNAVGYVSSEVLNPHSEAQLDKALTPEEEVRLLMQETGAEERDSISFPTRTTQVRYRVIAQVYIDLRKEPDINSELVEGQSLTFGDEFEVTEIFRSADTRTYFRLADGRGWAFDWAMVGNVRMPLVAPVDDGLADLKQEKRSYQKVCQRCWGLWQYNDCDDIFRPAFGKPAVDELTAEKFEEMLTKTLEPVKEAGLFAVVDVFDFGSSFKMLQFLAKQLKSKPGVRVRILANKMDLLPREVNLARVRGWVSREAQKAGLSKVKLTDVFPVSCHTGIGIRPIAKLLDLNSAPREFFIVGAANAGKSSLLNRLSLRKRRGIGETAAVVSDGLMGSVLPGTTLQPLVMKYQQRGLKLIDTPGLLVPGSLAEKLSLQDLRLTIPQKEGARRVTLHMKEGQSILLGALARIDMTGGRPFQFTLFTSEKVKLHRTTIAKASDIAERFAGDLLTPPLAAEQYHRLQPWIPKSFELQGNGWDEACADIVFHGLGWVSITGCGPCSVEAHAPAGVDVSVRSEPLMPFEAKWTGVSYKGWPGWFKIGSQTTRGTEAGRKRSKVKGKF